MLTRLRNFFHHRSPWQRRLWTIGTVVGLREVSEYARVGNLGGANKNDGLKYVASAMASQVARDLGVGEKPLVEAMRTLLTSFASLTPKVFPEPGDVLRLEHYADRASRRYLESWAGAVEAPDRPPVELVARSIATHLLDHGYSAAFLDEWTHSHMEAGTRLVEVVRTAEELVAKQLASFEGVYPPRAVPQSTDRRQRTVDTPHRHEEVARGTRAHRGRVPGWWVPRAD